MSFSIDTPKAKQMEDNDEDEPDPYNDLPTKKEDSKWRFNKETN
jgi:hypothetical protein